jgi:acetoacetyl-CoA synthetase
MRSGNDGPPVFLVHPIDGSTVQLARIANSIRCRNPIYGIQGKGLDGVDLPESRIESMADCYVSAITEVQPHGPYLLAGLCFGGLVAVEIARRLVERGESVDLLALLDAYPNPSYWPTRFWMYYYIAHHIHDSLATMKALSRQDAIAFVAKWFRSSLRKVRRLVSGNPSYLRAPDALPPRIKAVFEACIVASVNYKPRYYPGKITFLMCGYHPYIQKGPRAIWGRLAAEFEVFIEPASIRHDRIGSWLSERVQDALRSGTAPQDAVTEAESRTAYEWSGVLMRT